MLGFEPTIEDTYRSDHNTCPLRYVTLHTAAAVGTARPLLGSPRNGQAAFYLFQKHLLCWQYINSACHCEFFLEQVVDLAHAQCFPSYRLASVSEVTHAGV